ncbi:MAG: PD-(D/E)XK nuclease family protein [Anaerolineae bacterium]|nr:PD-(D/E)XK nuclease family protein [Anaerolineae bacterium]
MTIHLYLAPAGRGKTAYTLERIRQVRVADPLTSIEVILPNQAQVNAFRYRLSAAGGALGVQLQTFYGLYAEILAWAGKLEPCLPEPVQYHLLRSIVTRLTDEGRLSYYAPLRDKPGFVVTLRSLVEELKRAGIRREAFRQAIQSLPHQQPRLTELADIYAIYQDWLLDYRWADTEGRGWLAALALERQPDLGRHLRLLIVDGFDEFNPTQLDVLKSLAQRAAETIITLTGDPATAFASAGTAARPALRRFTRALQAVSEALKLEPEPLPQESVSPSPAALTHLEANLFNPHAAPLKAELAQTSVTFVEAQNRAEETRAALRWLKARLVRDRLAPADVALIARDLTPYSPFIEEVAAEFGLTLRLRERLNLAANPAVAALLSLLALPAQSDSLDGNWPRRRMVDAWRSPYFENLAPGVGTPHADHLDVVARRGLVIRGLDQWREALQAQVSKHSNLEARDDEDALSAGQLLHTQALALQQAFEAFVGRLTPPPQTTLRRYAAFVENLIGDDPKLEIDTLSPSKGEAKSLGLVNRARAVSATAFRDIAALRAFKDALRGLVLAEASLRQSSSSPSPPEITYDQFYQELQGAVQGATYALPPPDPPEAALPVLSALDARGLSFKAVALLGLAEGEFPRPEREDILLREEDRRALRLAGLSALENRLRGDEITLFYQAVTRAREKLFLCRPYLADDGQPWEPSPYWSQVYGLFDQPPPEHIRPEAPPGLSESASPQEFVQGGLVAQLEPAEFDQGEQKLAAAAARTVQGVAVLQTRLAVAPQGPFEGDLSALSNRLTAVYGPEHVWSATRLEAYGLCPHHFWLWLDLGLELRRAPAEGFDVFILGSMYHEILEEVYRRVADTPADSEHLLDLLPAVAQEIFDKAPAVYGFRPTALWAVQRRELEQIMAKTLAALAEVTALNTPLAQEQTFGLKDEPPLVVQRDGDEFRVRGFIDRIDQTADGRLCIIDYKSGATPIVARDLVEGRRLQIAFYALAARQALHLGDIADGFYWHIGSAKASSLKLEKFEGGVAGALNTAINHAFKHIAGVRAGWFAPLPPPAGCPGHCPGVKFCWQYQAKGW